MFAHRVAQNEDQIKQDKTIMEREIYIKREQDGWREQMNVENRNAHTVDDI